MGAEGKLDPSSRGDHWERIAERIDRHLEAFLPMALDDEALERFVGPAHWAHDATVHSEMLSDPVWDLIGRGGKRWRPAFGILLLESLGKSAEPYEAMIAATAELCHTGALIIDDIEDGSKIRRGEQTTHLRYGTDVAISAANTLYFLPHLLYWNHPALDDRQRLDAYRNMVENMVKAHFGQAMDIYWSRNLTPEKFERWRADGLPDKILQMYAFKTGSGLEGLSELACMLAAVDDEARRRCRGLARDLGVAFQIVDDVLDFEGSPSWRRALGHDVAAGKLTYVIVRALDLLESRSRCRLLDLLCAPSDVDDGVGEAMLLIRDSGALELCRGKAAGLFEQAWSEYSCQVADSSSKTMLLELCRRLIGEPDVG